MFAYVLVPTGAATATFYRMEFGSGALVPLTAPTFTANTVIGVGTAMCYDESMDRVWLFTAQSTTAGGYEWASFQYYDINANTWTARNVATIALAAQWGTGAALVHTDSDICVGPAIGGQVADNYIYLVGNNAAAMYRYSIVANTWTALAGAMGVRAAAPGAGSNVIWNEWNADQLVSWRGGGSALVDKYTISTDAWAAGVTPTVALPCTTGFESCSAHKIGSNSIIASGGTIYIYNHDSNRLTSQARIEGTDGLAHDGNSLCYYLPSSFSTVFVIIRPHSGRAVQRIRLID
jgi:hypothetical protein